MPFRRKILYYGLMLLLTLLALEGMAHIAYYAAYGQWHGRGRLAAPANSLAQQLPAYTVANSDQRRINHPFYAFSHQPAYAALNAMPPRQRREDTVVVGLLGGSVAEDFAPFFQRALNRWFAANDLPRPPAVLGLAVGGSKQPQQTMIVANALLLGGEFDLIVNLDGFNEVVLSEKYDFAQGLFPFFPFAWQQRVDPNGAAILLAGRIQVLRREQARLAAAGEMAALRRSALFGLLNRYRQERAAAQIIQRNRELAAGELDYSLERHGPRNWLAAGPERRQAAARVWYRSSVALARLAELAGGEYYHFLQPNQYVAGAKPLGTEELALAYSTAAPEKPLVEQGYPLLREFSRDLQNQGINYFDLTGIFADHPETLYRDACCHLNARGNELLAAAILRRMAPALRRLGQESPARPVSPLAAARRPAEAKAPRNALAFQVSLQADGKFLRYFRADCAAEDTEPLFFLHLIPRDAAALPPGRREQGFDDVTFNFARAGGRFRQGQCTAQIPLPDYPVAALRTGQYIPSLGNLWLGDLWSVELTVPAAPEQLRADYAALAAEPAAVRDYFDLYIRDNRLIYLRETCAAADTAAGFFLHIIPADAADLPAERRAAGFAHSGFAFARQGGHFDGKCLAAVALPDYPIKEMRTGQHIRGQDSPLWSVQLIAAPDPDKLRDDYAALAAVRPAVRDYFDLYWQGNRLLYLRERCAEGDTAAGFFLHIVPADLADLPADRRAAGFVHGGFEFVRQGGHFDGKCMAAVALPDYPIKEMRTGQHIPGQGELWSVQLRAAR